MRRRCILGILAANVPGRAFDGEARVWQAFLAWYRTSGDAADPVEGFKRHLLQSGTGGDEAGEAARIVSRLMVQRRDQWQAVFFDKTYASRTPRFNAQPNQLLIETVRGLRPGKALDVHMGQGRNAVYLAGLGWQVTGFDYSAEGIAAAQSAARDAGVELKTVHSRHEDFDFGRQQWDLVLTCYAWLPLEANWIHRITQALKPGGLLVFEHLLDQSGSDGAPAWLPAVNELPRLFAHMRILRYEDVQAKADWSWRPERVARLVAQRDLAIEQTRPGER